MFKISACLIAKNEEDNMDNCLKNLVEKVDEIIVVDTGSSDKTKQIAAKYTEKIYDYKWNDNFSDARNFSISKATYEYVLIIDCDEEVYFFDKEDLSSLIENNAGKIGRLLRRNIYHRGELSYTYVERVNRFFSKYKYHYVGKIHEQVVPIKEGTEETIDIPVEMNHSGYEGDLELRRKKTRRNISLLLCELEESPADPYVLYQLGKSYYMEEDYLSAYGYFDSALGLDLDIRLEYVQDMIESYGYTLLNLKEYETALQLCNLYEDFAHSADFVFLIGLIYMNNGKFPEAVQEFEKAGMALKAKMEGVNGYLSYYNIGVIYECLGDKENALAYYKRCGNYNMAKERLKIL